jgi:hypothetical protein
VRRASNLPSLEAAARLLSAVSWQLGQVASLDRGDTTARSAEEASHRAEQAAWKGDRPATVLALRALAEISAPRMMLAPSVNPRVTAQWSTVGRAVALATTLTSAQPFLVRYDGDRVTDGGYVEIVNGREPQRFEFQDSGAAGLTDEAAATLTEERWMPDADVPGGTLTTTKTDVVDKEMKRGGTYTGMGVTLWFVRGEGGCAEPMFVQLVKRDVLVNGTRSEPYSHDWGIDVIPSRDVPAATRAQWVADQPRYQGQNRDPRNEARNYMRDWPGLPRDDHAEVLATWRFRTYLLCCRPFSVLARIDWATELHTGLNVNPSTVRMLPASPSDPNVTLPHVETANPRDAMFDQFLAAWAANPERSCQTAS